MSFYSKVGFLFILLSADILLAKPIPVRDVKVDVQGKTALDARDAAMSRARQIAFAQLATEYPEFGININEGVPPDEILESLVIDYEVVREKMSPVRYMGVFNFNFNDRALQKYLSSSHRLVMPKDGVLRDATNRDNGYAHSQFLVIPVYISPDTSYLWEEENPWGRYWVTQETKSKGKVSDLRFTVPLGDLRDIAGLTIEDALTSKVRSISSIMERYQGNIAMVIVLKNLDDGVNSHELQVKTYTRSGVLQEGYEPIVLQGQKGVTMNDIFKKAVQKSLALITGKGDIEITTAVEPSHTEDDESDQSSPSRFKVVATFDNFQDWQAIRQALDQSDYIDDFEIGNLTKQKAEIYIKSRVPASELNKKLAQMGLKLDRSVKKPHLSLSNATNRYQNRPHPRVPSPFDPQLHEDDGEINEEMEGDTSAQPEVIE